MITKICFFNHWHNGDVFSAKGYIQDLIRQLPQFHIQHAQLNNAKTMIDLPCEHIHTDNLPHEINDRIRYHDVNGVFYINTWVGAYGNAVIPAGEHHANYPSLYTMWMHIYDTIDNLFGVNLQRTQNIMQYIPATDWTPYNTKPAIEFAGNKDRIVLFCNGLVRSTQSNLGVMNDIVEQLSHDYPTISFVCTTKFDTSNFVNKNVFFTDDIFANTPNGDINEIAFLSTKCEMIVGKNSGPFMFTHVRENFLSEEKAFFSCSHRPSDSYAHGISGYPCRYYHYSGEASASVVGFLRQAIDEKGHAGPRQMVVFD